MFDGVDLLVVISLCVIIIFCLYYLKCGKKVKVEKNIDQENDILQIFYDENIYKIEVGEAKNVEVKEIEGVKMELGITSVVDDGCDSGDEDESGGFFTYQPDENEESDEDIVPDPPKTWADFMKDAREEQSPETLSAHFQNQKKGRNKVQSSIKDIVAQVREDMLEKPLSDEDFKKKYFSRLYENKN
ncbi:MAG: hypothetical protein LBR79_06825 [Oscillospiraceae bacterium]|jgi:hypothetical protein|nr:hypothetical protein [Oscillospiraceae bacterium]